MHETTTEHRKPPEEISIRPARESDAPSIFALILELAEYERARDEVENTVEQLRTDGFRDPPLYHCFVAEEHGTVLGIALLYTRYSTWKGRCLYLEDLIVTRSRRGEGLGKRLMERCIAYARETGSPRLIWQVLDWNTDAIAFYQSLGASLQPEWVNCVLPITGDPAHPSEGTHREA